MTEITVKKAADLGASDTRTLLNFRDHTHESIVYGLTIQQLLDLYHASAEYVTLESWLDDDPKASAVYAQIAGQSLEDASIACPPETPFPPVRRKHIGSGGRF